ncbi:MAG: hypothetical protein AAF741_17660 [Bacteroidota bacterium]
MQFSQPISAALRAVLLSILVLLTVNASLSAQESLLSMAIRLDTLYDQLDENDNAAQDFFDELKKLYGQDGQIDEFVIQSDFGNNQYMSARVQNVFGELNMREDDAARELDSVNTRMDSLLNFAIARIEATCGVISNNLEECELYQIINDNFYEPEATILRMVREATEEGTKIRETLLKIEDEYLALQRIKTDLESDTESVLLLSADAGGGFNFSSAAESSQAFAPIVIQSPTGGSLQSSILDGTAKWIAERMREELSIAFFDRFKTWIGNGNLDYLFPNTVGAMNISATADYSLLIQILKTAFEQDLHNMPFNMGNFLRAELNEAGISERSRQEMAGILTQISDNYRRLNTLSREVELVEEKYYAYDGPLGDSINTAYEEQLDKLYLERDNREILLTENDSRLATMSERSFKRQRILRYALLAITAIQQLSEGSHPTTLLSFLNDNIDELIPGSDNVKPAILVMDVISRSLISVDEEKNTVWVKGNELRKLSENAQLREFFFGLIYQQVKQTMRRRQNGLREQLSELNSISLQSSPKFSELQDTMYIRREAVQNIMYFNDIRILADAENSFESMVDNYLVPPDENPQYEDERAALELFHRRLAYDETDLVQNFDIAEYVDVNNTLEAALVPLVQRVTEVYNKYDIPDLEYDTSYIKRSFNLFSGSADGASIDQSIPFIDQFEINWQDWMAYSSIPGDNEAAFSEIYEAYTNVYPVALDNLDYMTQIYSRLDRVRSNVYNEINNNSILVDSFNVVESILNKIPRYQRLNLRLSQLDEQQFFIDNLLLENSFSFGNLINDFVLFANRVDQIQSELKSLRQSGNATIGSTEFVFLLRNSLDIIPQIFSIALPEDEESTLLDVQMLTAQALDAYTAVLEEDYDAIVMNLVSVAGTLIDKSYENRIKFPFEGEDSDAYIETLRQQQARSQRTLNEIFRYGAFLAAVVESQSSDDIKSAIRAIALPSGSYSIKRRSFANISLNAYPGLTGGAEYISNDIGDDVAPNFGFTAPIGLAFSWGYKSKFRPKRFAPSGWVEGDPLAPSYVRYQTKLERSPQLPDGRFLNGASGSLFFPLIDLGALVLFRLDGSNEPLPEDVGFQQVFSPGVAYAHGFANLPLSVSAGMQLSPSLRRLGDESANSFRFNLGILVDLPMANFHTRSVQRY